MSYTRDLKVYPTLRLFLCPLQGSGLKGEATGDPAKNGVGRPPQGCLQYILDCNGVAVGPKQVQAN